MSNTINVKSCSPDLMRKYQSAMLETKKAGLTGKLVINRIIEKALDTEIANGFPTIKKILKI